METKLEKVETMAAGPEPEQYGLTVGSTVQEGTAATEGVAAAAAAPPRGRSAFQEMEVQKLREVLSLLPEEPSFESYHQLPVEEFGEALLRGLGWERGKPIGRNRAAPRGPSWFPEMVDQDIPEELSPLSLEESLSLKKNSCSDEFRVEAFERRDRRRRGGVKVVPRLENSWPPEKRMKNVAMESDVTKLTEGTSEMENMAAGPKHQYGLTAGSTVQEETASQKLREVRVEKFGEALSRRLREPTCRVCKSNDISVLILPCLHLCSCKECAALLEACPLCHNLKEASVEVYIR